VELPRRRVGRTDLEVTVLGFGGAPLGGMYRSLPDEAAQATIAAAYEAGIRYFDTAPFYGHGLSEHRLGHGLRLRPQDEFVLSSKVGRLLTPVPDGRLSETMFHDRLPFEIVFDYGYEGVMRSVEHSYQRLGMSRIEILFAHDVNRRWHGEDLDRRFDEFMSGGYRALDELRRNRHVQAIGVA